MIGCTDDINSAPGRRNYAGSTIEHIQSSERSNCMAQTLESLCFTLYNLYVMALTLTFGVTFAYLPEQH